jgi:hypothetical protein
MDVLLHFSHEFRNARCTANELLQRLMPDWRIDLPGNDRCALGMFGDDLPDKLCFVTLPTTKNGISHRQRQQTLVDDPDIRLDFGATKISL